MTNDSASVPDFVHTFPDILAPFVPTPPDVVERVLELAGVGGDDFLFDLGCGDGCIPIIAAQKYGARAFGVDAEPYRVTEVKQMRIQLTSITLSLLVCRMPPL